MTPDRYGTPEMFTLPGGGDPMSGAERLRAPRSVAHAKCPGCNRQTAKGDTKLTGLIRSGPHLVWRAHDIVTWSGARRPCPNSGIPICATGATLPCPCGTRPT